MDFRVRVFALTKVRLAFSDQLSLILLVVFLSFSSTIIAEEIAIKNAQSILNAIGYEAGSEDGRYGPNTESALRLFQRDHNILVTGLLDKQTEEHLAIRLEIKTSGENNSTSSFTTNPRSTVLKTNESVSGAVNPSADKKSELIGVFVIVILGLYLLVCLWALYRFLRWVKIRVSSLFSKLIPCSKTENLKKYDLKANQLGQRDSLSRESNDSRKKRNQIKESDHKTDLSSIAHKASETTTKKSLETSKSANTVEDNRSFTRKGIHVVKELIPKKHRSTGICWGSTPRWQDEWP